MKKLLVFFTIFGIVIGGLYFMNEIDHPKLGSLTPVNPIDLTPPPLIVPKQQQQFQSTNLLSNYIQQAQRENKKVFLMLSMNNCVYCDLMRKNVLPNVDMSGYVFLETKDQAIIRQYLGNSGGFPTFVILDKNGAELKRRAGYMSVSDFRSWVN